jgi:branched-chain amino acid transport system substrate-binding protein
MKRYHRGGDAADAFNVIGGDDLTRENVMKQAASLKDVDLTMLLPGIRINTSPTDYQPIKQAQLQRFDGSRWVKAGK